MNAEDPLDGGEVGFEAGLADEFGGGEVGLYYHQNQDLRNSKRKRQHIAQCSLKMRPTTRRIQEKFRRRL